ncbi:unnamed protein product, partial [Ectocarpus sp. 6 AP-2014]
GSISGLLGLSHSAPLISSFPSVPRCCFVVFLRSPFLYHVSSLCLARSSHPARSHGTFLPFTQVTLRRAASISPLLHNNNSSSSHMSHTAAVDYV